MKKFFMGIFFYVALAVIVASWITPPDSLVDNLASMFVFVVLALQFLITLFFVAVFIAFNRMVPEAGKVAKELNDMFKQRTKFKRALSIVNPLAMVLAMGVGGWTVAAFCCGALVVTARLLAHHMARNA